jgi:hypothetical protein
MKRPLPSSTVADLCEVHSWDDDINDGARFALEHAHNHIRRLMRRATRCAQRAERMEAEVEKLKAYIVAMAAQDGGAA